MPYLKVQANVEIEAATGRRLLQALSRTAAEALGKSEDYVMVALEPATPMLFAGSDAPAAYLELKSIGLPEQNTPQLCASLSAVMEEVTGVPRDRVYIEFANAPRNMWGWNGSTF